MDRITILLVDDHQLAREGIKSMLSHDPKLNVIGEASSAQEAIKLADELKPRVIFMDIRLKGSEYDGLTLTSIIKEKHPDIHVIILSFLDEETYVRRAIEVGASGYLLKDISMYELISAVFTVVGGGAVINPQIGKKLLEEFAGLMQGRPRTSSTYEDLTKRESEILRAIAAGKSNQEISDELFISIKTVKTHLTSIYKKLQVKDRTQAVAYAIRKGMVQ